MSHCSPSRHSTREVEGSQAVDLTNLRLKCPADPHVEKPGCPCPAKVTQICASQMTKRCSLSIRPGMARSRLLEIEARRR